MIPDFDNGNLPPGIHGATLDEIEHRFGRSTKIRRAQMEALREAVGLLKRAGALRIMVNGSFVTKKKEPNDVDCAALIGVGYPQDQAAADELLKGLPFVALEFLEEADFLEYIDRQFGTDRRMRAKGMLEVSS